MWDTSTDQLALLELLVRGVLVRRQAQDEVWRALAELPWTRLTSRRDVLGVVEARRHELVALLDRVWPSWGDGLAALSALGLPPTPDGWSRYLDSERASRLPPVPPRVNRRTAAALVAPHSKATLTPRRLAALGEAEPTHDGAVRMKPPAGLIARTRRGAVDLSAVAAVLGEVSMPERAMRDELALEGPIEAVLLVENLGAFTDLPPLEGWLVIHVAGWDTATVTILLALFGTVPVVHFGDLDPAGVRIYRHLRERRPDLSWFVPPFAAELIEVHALQGIWPDDLGLQDAPELVRELARRGLWLEQEPIAIDPRTPASLRGLLAHGLQKLDAIS
jgi:hypothetical protein